MQIETGAAMVVIRCVMLIAIALRLATYHDPSARHRACVSFMATLAAGASLGWAVHSVLMLLHSGTPDPRTEFWPMLFVLCALIPVLYSRGNVAKLLPRVKWLHS